MAQEKKGLIARMLEGKEKSEEYARSTLPTNRWQLFWDIFKGNFGKIFKVNLLILIFFIPFIAIIIFHNVALQQYGLIFPFGANLTFGYPANPDTDGFAEMLALQQDALLLSDVRHPQHGLDGGHFCRQRFLAGRQAQLLERVAGSRLFQRRHADMQISHQYYGIFARHAGTF